MKKNFKKNSKEQYTSKNNYKNGAKGTLSREERLRTCDKMNDPSWYAQDSQLIKDVASLSFAQMAGNNNDYPAISGVGHSISLNYIPGIMKIVLDQTIGAGKISTDAPSVAARNIYTFVRHANSGSANYESADLYMMILAHASAQSYLEELKRVYGILTLFSTRNRYYGKTLVESMGYNYDNLAQNMPGLRAHINITANKLNSIKIPNSLPITARWKWCSSNYYGDSNSPKAQLYYYQFRTYLKFSGYSSETGTELIPTVWIPLESISSPETNDGGSRSMSTGKTLDDIKAFTDSLIDPLFYEEDVGIMSGDILKAFGDAVTVVSGIDENWTVMPAYSEEVLNQIHNIKFVGCKTRVSPSSHSIRQSDGNTIIENINFASTMINDGLETKILENPFLYDSYYTDNRPEDVMVGTRLIPVVEGFANKALGYSVTTCGSEIPLCAFVYSNSNPTLLIYSRVLYAANANLAITALSAFDWHPRALVYEVNDGSPNLTGWLGDLENYTILHNSVVGNMHKVAILSELAYSARTNLTK